MGETSVELFRADMARACGSSEDKSVFPFSVLPLDAAARLCGGGVETLGGGGNRGGNFSWRVPLRVFSFSLPSPSISPSTVCTGSDELDLTSERNSKSSLERANELRGDERARENRLRKRDTADSDGNSCISSSCAIKSAEEVLGSKENVRNCTYLRWRVRMGRPRGSLGCRQRGVCGLHAGVLVQRLDSV